MIWNSQWPDNWSLSRLMIWLNLAKLFSETLGNLAKTICRLALAQYVVEITPVGEKLSRLMIWLQIQCIICWLDRSRIIANFGEFLFRQFWRKNCKQYHVIWILLTELSNPYFAKIGEIRALRIDLVFKSHGLPLDLIVSPVIYQKCVYGFPWLFSWHVIGMPCTHRCSSSIQFCR